MPEVSVNHSLTDHRGLKTKLHTQLLEEIDLESLNRLSEGVARERVGVIIRDMLHRERTPLASVERERIVLGILDELFGLGPLEPLLADGTISDILVNGSQKIFVERRGKLEATGARFDDDAHLMRIIDRIVSRVGRRVDETSPMVDARLPDGSRFNAIIPPLALDGPVVTIRMFGSRPLTQDDLLRFKAFTPEMLALMEGAMKARLNIMISMAGLELPIRALRSQFASAIDLIIQASRLQGGPRKVTSISEVIGMEGDTIIMQEIFNFRQIGINENGRAFGEFVATGI